MATILIAATRYQIIDGYRTKLYFDGVDVELPIQQCSGLYIGPEVVYVLHAFVLIYTHMEPLSIF